MRLVSLALLLTFSALPARAAEQPPLPVWPGAAPDEPAGISEKKVPTKTGGDGVIRIGFVDKPELIRYPAPAENRTGTCVIICPGGGYNILAWNKEGTEIAQWLNTLGIEAVVLKYRVPRRDAKQPHPWPLQDLQRSIRLVRHHAAEWKVDPKKIGVMGFSAGGHLAAMASSHADKNAYAAVDAIDKLDARPDFQALIYPAYLGDMKTDAGKLDPLVKVGKQTPPTFVALTHDDADRSLFAALYYAELRRAGVQAELHIFQKGGHGYGMRDTGSPVNGWPSLMADWLRTQKLAGAGDNN